MRVYVSVCVMMPRTQWLILADTMATIMKEQIKQIQNQYTRFDSHTKNVKSVYTYYV
jgi:hypothetical protein